MVKSVVIIQARLNSKRLPGKILYRLPFGTETTVINQIIKRSKKINIDEVILATSDGEEDDKLEDIAKIERVKIFRGDRDDVLSRFYYAAKESKADIIVRITADNPCIDPFLTRAILNKHLENKSDYTTTKGYPIGLNVEVFNFYALQEAHKRATKDYEREHVTFYFHKNLQEFKVNIIEAEKELYFPDIRVTLDTEEDYALLCAVFDFLYPKNEYFRIYDVINLFKEKPWLKFINRKIVQKGVFDNLDEEIKEAVKVLDLQDLKRARDFLKRYLEKDVFTI